MWRLRDSLVSAARTHVTEVRDRFIAQGLPAEQAPAVPSAAEVRERAYLPAYHPPIRAVRIGVDGTIWLQRTDGLRPGPWVAFDRSGTPLFRLSLPEGASFHHGSRGSVWGTQLDADDVPYLVRWAIDPAAAGTGSPGGGG